MHSWLNDIIRKGAEQSKDEAEKEEDAKAILEESAGIRLSVSDIHFLPTEKPRNHSCEIRANVAHRSVSKAVLARCENGECNRRMRLPQSVAHPGLFDVFPI